MENSPQTAKRREGRTRALEGLLASRFGRRPTKAGDKAIEQLRSMRLPSAKARIFSETESRLPFSCWSWLAMAASVALLAGGLVYWTYPWLDSSAMAIFDDVPPDLIVSREGVHFTPQKGMRIEEGDAIIANSLSETNATLILHREDVVVSIRPGASLQLSKENGLPFIQVLQGRIEVDARRLQKGVNLELGTLQARARTAGGRFSLAAKLTSTWLEVSEGSVELRRSTDPESIRVDAEHYAVAALGLVLAPHSQLDRWQTPYSVASPNVRSASSDQ